MRLEAGAIRWVWPNWYSFRFTHMSSELHWHTAAEVQTLTRTYYLSHSHVLVGICSEGINTNHGDYAWRKQLHCYCGIIYSSMIYGEQITHHIFPLECGRFVVFPSRSPSLNPSYRCRPGWQWIPSGKELVKLGLNDQDFLQVFDTGDFDEDETFLVRINMYGIICQGTHA